MALDFLYSQPVRIYFGAGRFAALNEILEERGFERCIIVCGRHFAPKARELQESSPRIVGVFDAVRENPLLSGIIEAAALARSENADTVIGIGGGSAMDTAKFAAVLANAPGAAEDYYRGKLPLPLDTRLNIVAVPTTAGTGSEVTQVSVVSHGAEKRTINDPAFMPMAAIVDPELALSVPPRTTMITGLDALAHALEGYWSINHQPICDLMAVEAVRLVLSNLERAYLCGSDIEARSNMALASLLGGLAFALPKTAGCHACSYPLSEDYGLSHGEACAFTLDSFVMLNADERLDTLCRRVGLTGSAALAARIRALKALAGLRCRLSDLPGADADTLAAACLKHPLMRNNPVQPDIDTLSAMFKALG